MSEASIKKGAGYVQVEGFARAGAGYFCGTCSKLQYLGGTDGYCKGLKVPVETYGCCNYWAQAPDHQMRGANGVRLVLVVDG
jgi:hypothetical protein